MIFIAVFSGFENLSLIWTAFVLAEAVMILPGMILWKKQSGKVLKPLEQVEQIALPKREKYRKNNKNLALD